MVSKTTSRKGGQSTSQYQHIKDANKYCADIVSGKIPACRFVKAAVRRHLNDLKQQSKKSFPYRFDERKGNRVCNFIEKLPHIKGKWAGQPIKLEPWQKFILTTLFGWVRKSDGYRRFRELYLEVPRKNAKSTIAAGIGLYMFTEDGEPGSEVYSGATTEKQAWEVFKPARLMAMQAEDQGEYFKTNYGIAINAKNLSVLNSASKFEPVIGNPGDGASPHCAIIDEFHEHKTPDQYDTMITGMGARTQPMTVIITTAGSNLGGPCYDKRGQVIKILDGVFENDDIFGIIYTLDDDDDWTDIKNWRKANPNFGVSVFEDYLKARLLEAKQRTSRQNIIRCKHLNQWMNAATAWMDMLKWKVCEDTTLSIDKFRGSRCIAALDIGTKIDLTAKIRLFIENGDFYIFGRYWLPEATAELPENTHYQGWVADGWIKKTSGDVIDFDLIEDEIREDCKHFEMSKIAYDPWQASQLALRMQAEGAPMYEYKNQTATFSEPMKQTQALVYSRRLHHNGDPVLAWMMSNVVAKLDNKDNIYPKKERYENKIDGVVALIMAVGIATLIPEMPTEVDVWG